MIMDYPEFESVLEGYPVRLANFEGPLDLLLHLIKKHEVEIYDIPIALITQQYLEYIDLMQELNLDVAGDFLVMAATLIHIKSRMLLPRADPAQEDAEEDPRVRAPALVGLAAIADLLLLLLAIYTAPDGVLSRPPYRALFCRAKRARQ